MVEDSSVVSQKLFDLLGGHEPAGRALCDTLSLLHYRLSISFQNVCLGANFSL